MGIQGLMKLISEECPGAVKEHTEVIHCITMFFVSIYPINILNS